MTQRNPSIVLHLSHSPRGGETNPLPETELPPFGDPLPTEMQQLSGDGLADARAPARHDGHVIAKESSRQNPPAAAAIAKRRRHLDSSQPHFGPSLRAIYIAASAPDHVTNPS